MLQSPFSKLSKTSEKKLTIGLLILLLITISSMLFFDGFLKNEIAKNGIISFELAKELETSKAVINSWNEQSKIAASLSMGLDFLFLIVYASFIAILIHKLNDKLWKDTTFYTIGNIFVWGAFMMALSDAIENIALIRLLMGDLQQYWSSIAYYFAILKFVILALGILYVLINFGLLLIRKINK